MLPPYICAHAKEWPRFADAQDIKDGNFSNNFLTTKFKSWRKNAAY